jgi:hypothetical protein
MSRIPCWSPGSAPLLELGSHDLDELAGPSGAYPEPGRARCQRKPASDGPHDELNAFAGDAHLDTAPADPSAEFGVVVGLVARSLSGLRRRRPRRDRIARIACTNGLSA